MHSLIVGLGNPGKKYEMTRHNIGFLVVERLAEMLGAQFVDMPKFESRVAEETVDGKKIHLVLPQTYMNESGRAVQKIVSYYKLPIDELIVVVDDMDLPFGHLRIRSLGSSGGHNGLKSIEAMLNTREYARLKIGIGRDVEAIDHVLGRFSSEEKKALPECVKQAADVLKRLLVEDIQKVINGVNRRVNRSIE